MRPQARNVCPYDDDDSDKELWVRDGVAVSCARVGSGPDLEGF